MRKQRKKIIKVGDRVRSGGTDEPDRITGTVNRVEYDQHPNGSRSATVLIYVDWPDLTSDDSGFLHP